jgi:hypothetical protein
MTNFQSESALPQKQIRRLFLHGSLDAGSDIRDRLDMTGIFVNALII